MKKVKRFYILLTVIIGLIFLLIGRLAQIQLISTESFSKENINLIEASVKQRTQEMTIDDGRGKFISRNGAPLTYDTNNRLVLFPFLKKMDWPVKKVAEIVDIPSFELISELGNGNKPVVIEKELTSSQMEQINNLKYPGIFAVPLQQKNSSPLAYQLIGVIRQNEKLIQQKYEEELKKGELSIHTPIGITGLQASFDRFLFPEQESKLLYHVDRFGGPLFGIDVKYTGAANPFYPVNIKTTIDENIQQMAQDVVEKHKLKRGGVVLLDVETNELLALVSKPDINESNPYDEARGIENRMLVPQIPGSIFKTVTAAAAIEEGADIYNRWFDCDLNVRKKELDEDKKMGQLTFEDSFARSCNFTFGTLANEIIKKDPAFLEAYAEKLGLLGPVGWSGDVFHFENFRQLKEEKQGVVWKTKSKRRDWREVSQTAIGQRDVRVTPLAVANMMATIARGGDRFTVRAVDQIQYKNGASLYNFRQQEDKGEKIKPYTAIQLQKLLREVVTHQEGTGRRFQTLPYEVAGKSGTADVIQKKEGEWLVNKWFAGYFPASSPKYALVVVDLSTESVQSAANSVFYDIVQELYTIDQTQK
ncbi:peptidoglycan D,D-transpeptidase FtsI family protein [Bacillus songklensis]|uniref:serine-type D-Ala-D-Ala carboxypeptidase n=1 Tax=Bacillus songklensis TaxID=1069116 RepID=A0ABV8AYF8_9BACI